MNAAPEQPVAQNSEAPALHLLTEELPPLNFTENGEIRGLSVDMIREIQRRLGIEYPIQMVPWARGYHTLQERPNVALFSTARSSEREALFQWVGPLTNLAFVFYKRADSPLELEDLDEARQLDAIATYRDDVREQFLIERGFTNLDSSTKLISGARKLLEGRVDVWLDSNLSAPSVMRQLGRSPDAIERALVIHSEPIYIAFSKQTSPAIVSRWQHALDAMARDGTFARLHRQWLPNEPLPTRMAALIPSPELTNHPLQLYTEELPPFNFTQHGKPTGKSVDIVHEIQRRLSHDAPIQFVPWTRGYQTALESANVGLFTTARTTEREGLFQWVGPIGHSRVHLYARSDANLTVTSLEDARQLGSIGTYEDDAGEQFLSDHGFTNLYGHRSPTAALRNLKAGRIQLWASAEENARVIIALSGHDANGFEPVYTLYEVAHYIAFSLDTPKKVVALWQQTLDAMRKDGTLARIQQRWQNAPYRNASP
ncbi:substrate-binding periplasmic protein [Modicisalibacter muralis]|uniref:substrate-binding periplasmic protein n=1 Tax=Modicisalibacter muralis TaxID=119000 RepID=UPI0011142861|nr:transporter substrate-binding domain-containing protein [Halomonas muralis]